MQQAEIMRNTAVTSDLIYICERKWVHLSYLEPPPPTTITAHSIAIHMYVRVKLAPSTLQIITKPKYVHLQSPELHVTLPLLQVDPRPGHLKKPKVAY